MDATALLTYGVSMGLFILRRPVHALVWIMLAMFIIPAENLGLAAFVLFLVLIYLEIQKVSVSK